MNIMKSLSQIKTQAKTCIIEFQRVNKHTTFKEITLGFDGFTNEVWDRFDHLTGAANIDDGCWLWQGVINIKSNAYGVSDVDFKGTFKYISKL